jgi:hypothetical protein
MEERIFNEQPLQIGELEELRGLVTSQRGYQLLHRLIAQRNAQATRIVQLERDAARIRLDEREACCAILKSAEPNTRAEKAIARIHARLNELPGWLAGELAVWMNATADELADMQAAIRARSKTLDEKPAEQLELGGGSPS